MEGNKSPSRKRPNPQLTGNGGSKRGRQDTSGRAQSFGNSDSSDTVYRILCQSKKMGSVIGKGGTIVKALREETRAKITIADSDGSDERVIVIHSPAKIHEKENSGEDQEPVTEKEDMPMKPHCPAQDALLKVHDRIIDEDLVGGTGDDNESVVTARLLVANNVVGCILGRKGDVIQRLRTDTGASIRVLPAEHLPPCAQSTDELVQISGKPELVKTALYEISTLLHQNPKKDNALSSFPKPYGTQGFRPPGRPVDIPPPGIPTWSHRHSNPRDMPPVPWEGGYRNQPAGFGMYDFIEGPPLRGGEAPSEFTMKIVCPGKKIGGVIGKGGFNVKRLQQETGATIKVEEVSEGSEERIIRISSYEDIRNPRSPTIEAILHLQDQTSGVLEKEIITTKLLVHSGKVGCILGQGGHIINQMRKRTQADIRVYSKKDKPKYAAADEELVLIVGSFGIAKDALVEIASRLRERYLREAITEAEPAPIKSGFDPDSNLPQRVSHGSGSMRGGSSSRYDFVKGGGHEYELSDYPVPPSATRYSNISSLVDVDMPNDAVRYGVGRKGGNIPEIAGRRSALHDSESGGSRGMAEYRGNSEHFSAAQNYPHQPYVSASEENWNPPPPQGSRQNYNNTQQVAYSNDRPQSATYHLSAPQTQQYPHPSTDNPQRPYENMNAEKSSYPNVHPQRQPYQDSLAQRQPYQDSLAERQPYQDSHAQRQPYQEVSAQRQPYQEVSAQRQPYQDVNAQPPAPYQNAGAHGSYRY